jgi:hypothetical protein
MPEYVSFPKNLITRVAWDGKYQPKVNAKSTEFKSGKKRTYRLNTWTPLEFPGLEIVLNNANRINGKTEADRFKEWVTATLRDGVLPFSFYKIKGSPGEQAVYELIDNKVNYEESGDVIVAGFGFREFLA